MGGIDLSLALPRGLHLTALVSTFGTLAFAVLVAPGAMRPRLMRLARVSAWAALATGAVWFAVQAATFAGTWDLWQAVPDTALYTRFGQSLCLRFALLLAVLPLTALPRHSAIPALLPAGIALGMQGVVGHAGAAEGNAALGLIAGEALHLIAAGAWLGALAPLLIALRTLPPHEARQACERFSPLGMAAVLVIAATALLQSATLIGGLPGLLGTPYGRTALIKLALFLGMLGFAIWNRLSLTDRLEGAAPAQARRLLFLSVSAETMGGVLVVLMAGMLAALPPGAHQDPVWPFPWRLSLTALDDPDLRREVALALLVVGTAIGAVALAAFARRGGLFALLLSVPLIVWQAPSLGLLLVDAYPTSFRTSPTGFSVASIARGQVVYAANCIACHGATGQGNGPAAAGLRVKPADLTAGHLWDHADGELFWWLSHGIDAPDGGLSMPGFATAVAEDDRWSAIDFVRTLNAGAAMRDGGSWAHPIPAPDLPIACDGIAAERLRDLRGRFVRIVAAGPRDPNPTAPPPDAVVLRLDRTTGRAPPHGGCASASADAWDAYAAIAGTEPAAMTGANFLVDPIGWLRETRSADRAADWNDPIMLHKLCETLLTQPVGAAIGGIHVHGQ